MKYINLKNSILVCLITIFFPFSASAISLTVENKSNDIKVGDVVILDLYLSTDESEEINAVEGTINIDGDIKVKQIITAGSVFDLWPNTPSFEDSKISFVGGSASSVFGNKLKLFSVVAEIQSESEISFSPEYFNAYLNDGIGTKIALNDIKNNIRITDSSRDNKNEFETLLFSDKKSPNKFEVFIGRDENTFDGKYFASFNTTDEGSGIERYEIIENNSKTPILTGTTYVLQDQSLKGNLIVKAFDHAGNVQVQEINIGDNVSDNRPVNWFGIFLAVIIISSFIIIFKKIKLKNR